MIRPYRDTDREAVLRINAENVPEVGPMDGEKLDLLLDAAGMFRVVEVDGEVVGLFIGLPEGTAYGSPNYAWFGALVLHNIYDAAEFLDVASYTNVVRWAEEITARPAVKRGQRVNRAWGPEEEQVIERHSAADFK